MLKTQQKNNNLKISTKKEHIPKDVKETVWMIYMNKADNRIAQCFTCEKYVRYPEILKHHYEHPHIELKYKKKYVVDDPHLDIILSSSCAEFGHIISEYNGGKATADNLVIQCKDCNLKLHTNNITHCMKSDTVMIDINVLVNGHDDNTNCDYSLEEYKCSYIINKNINKQCNNKRLDGRDRCQIHLYK